MSKLNGYILFVTLIFLQIISVFSLNQLKLIQMNLKSISASQQTIILKLQAREKLAQIEAQLLAHKPNCIIDISSVQLAKKPFTWWQKNACHILQDYYVIETFTNNPCALIDSLHAQYYRVTLLTVSKDRSPLLLMQSVVALPTQEKMICTNQTYSIQAGRQTLRELQVAISE